MSVSPLTPALKALSDGRDLAAAEIESVFDTILSGGAEPVEIAGLLMGLAAKGETVEELLGAARALRTKALGFSAPEAVDTCGTGGDGQGTVNISTAAAILAAAAGAKVAKHGNRSVSSKSGSSDVIARLGIALDLDVAGARACLDRLGICFLMAPNHHCAVAHVMPVRRALKVRTLFNLLGPLANPAGAEHQLLGVYHPRWLAHMAEALKALGSRQAWVVHGADGMDELSVTGPSHVQALTADGRIERFELTPEAAGLSRHPLSALIGGTADDNAAALTRLLDGEAGAYRDAAALNAGAALVIAGRAESLADGVAQALAAVDDGRAKRLVADWAALSQSLAQRAEAPA